MARFVKVARESRLPENRGAYVEVEGRPIALLELGEEVYALDNDCTHMGGPLSQGSFPARESGASREVRILGDDVEV